MLLTEGVLWFGLARPLQAATGDDLSWILTGASYPLLDAIIVYVAFARWRESSAPQQKATLGWLTMSMIAYRAANWINYWVRGIEPDADSVEVTTLWLLADLFASAGGWQFKKRGNSEV